MIILKEMNPQKKILKQVLESATFKRKLATIHKNYSNLKQEVFIRNSIVECINGGNVFFAFAEHPREKNHKTDLSLM